MKQKISITTGTRSEYGILRELIKEISKSKKLELYLLVTGMHLSKKFGYTINEIKKDKIPIHAKIKMIPSGNTPYDMSVSLGKGIVGFSKSMALELGSRNIRTNVIAPGFIETEMTGKLDEKTVQSWRDAIPLKRGGSPEDIANVCVFLGSDMSGYVTGQVLNVDGGMLT